MAGYSTSNPPSLLVPSFNGQTPQIWVYKSATDSNATIDTSGYITNGGNLGMRVGDIVLAYDVTNTIVKSHQVLTVSATAPGAVDLSDGVTIGGSTNTD